MKKLYIALICLSAVLVGVFGALFIRDKFFSSTPDEAFDVKYDTFEVEAGTSVMLPFINAEAADMVVSCCSSDEDKLAVDSGGRLDAKKPGEVTVSANLSNGNSHTFNVTVTEPDKMPKEKVSMNTTAITANSEVAEKNMKNKDEKLPFEIQVNRKQNCVTVFTYDKNGNYTVPVRAMVCSVGVEETTEKGEFHIFFHTAWHPLINDVYGQYSSAFYDDLLFHSVPYNDLSPDTLKIDEFNKLGEAASRGCVRMMVSDCKWICDNCDADTVVKIFDSDAKLPLGKPETIRITDKNLRWDPTDPDERNPYLTRLPVISGAHDTVLRRGAEYSVTDGVTAADTCGNDITGRMTVTGRVNPDNPGTYRVTYEVTDALHRSARKDITVVVE